MSRDDLKTAAKAAALGLLQPLEALSLDADILHTATAAAVAYCDAQGASSFADLVERASKLIAHPQAVAPSAPGLCGLAPMAWRLCPAATHMPGDSSLLFSVRDSQPLQTIIQVQLAR